MLRVEACAVRGAGLRQARLTHLRLASGCSQAAPALRIAGAMLRLQCKRPQVGG